MDLVMDLGDKIGGLCPGGNLRQRKGLKQPIKEKFSILYSSRRKKTWDLANPLYFSYSEISPGLYFHMENYLQMRDAVSNTG